MIPCDRFSWNITKSDSLLLKGMGILAIMCHNFFHLLPGSLTENEFVFDASHAQRFLHDFGSLSVRNPGDIEAGVAGLFSFLGHYGVVIFIFLSAYGLTRKYEKHNPGIKETVYPKLLKFWKLLIPVLAICILWQTFYACWRGETHWMPVALLKDSFLHVLFIHTLYPGKALSIVGAWWFFGVIVQFYFLFPFLNRLRPSRLMWLVAASWILQAVCLRFFPDGLFFLRTNFPGWLPEFCLGIYLAKEGIAWKVPYVVIPASLVFAGSFLNGYVWLAGGVAVIFLWLGAAYLLKRIPVKPVRRFFILAGEYSFYLFVIHGFVRDYILASGLPERAGPLLSAFIFLVLSGSLAVAVRFAGYRIGRRPVPERI